MRWRWLLVRVVLAGALAGRLALAAATGEPPVDPVVLDQAAFLVAGAAEQAVPLPDTWARRGLPNHGTARYRLVFQLDRVPDQPLAVRFTRVSSTRKVMLNGRLITAPNVAGRDHPVPEVFDLPSLLLRPGRNELELEVRYRSRAGLSAATIGPANELRLVHDRDALWSRELPRILNMGMMVLAAFMFSLWWRRRSEWTIGLFGVLLAVGSLRNYTYFSDVSLLPAGVTDWFFYAAQIWTVTLFCAFALSLDDGHAAWRRGWRWLAAIAIAMPLLAIGFSAASQLPVLRTVTYPVLFVLAVVAVRFLWRSVRAQGDLTHVALVGSFAAVVAAGAHDYLFQQGLVPITGTFWLPFAMPVGFGIYGMMLMGRLVSAVGEVERLNVELEHRVLARTRALQTANLAKTRFLASASHDLRQPVAAIGLMVGLLREQVPDPRLRGMIDRVDHAVASMESMLKGLLDLSRLESGTVHARVAWVPLQTVFDAIALHEREAADARRLTLRFRPTRLAVLSDPVLLEQVLRNLVSNAVRYTERGGVLVTARARGDGEVLLQVWDTGVGIAAEHQATIFEEFVQVGGAAAGSRGLGLGLAIVQRSLAVLGHPLTLKSRPGRGSCFGVRVPRGHDERRARPRVDGPAAPTPLVGLRVLLVEDDADVRHGLVERLRSWGAEVSAFDGITSLRAALPPAGAPRGEPMADLVVTDQALPGGSGLLVIELVRQRVGAIHAMVVTGDTSPGDLTLLEASGVPVLHKPFRTEALLATVHLALAATALGELPG